VPGDADLLVVAGPQRAFLDNELAALERYLDRGGRAWFMLEPRMSPELVALLAERGIAVGDDVIIDQVVQLFAGPSVGVEPVVSDYGFHPITEQLGQNTLFRLARSVRPAEELPAGITVTELARTSNASWAETNLDLLFESGEVDPEGDTPGPVSLAVAATLTGEALSWTAPAIDSAPDAGGSDDSPDDAVAAAQDEDAQEAETAADEQSAPQTAPAGLEGRVVVVGDAEWVNNSRLTLMFNEDLALNMVGWLTGGDEESVSIRPRGRRASRISLTEAEGWRVFYATVLLLPELVLLCGLTIWWRRRR
jgi:ABC-type uncharacterized transport system involved in gliding motility auxiliary subunit